MVDKVRCAHILVKTEEEAKQVLKKLEGGEKFANLASEKSLCPSGKKSMPLMPRLALSHMTEKEISSGKIQP